MQPHDSKSSETSAGEKAARASFLRRHWGLVRVFDRLGRLLLPVLPPPRVASSASCPRRILVIEYNQWGDLAIVVPFLRNLRRCFPLVQISLLVDARRQAFLDGQGLVDEFIPVRVPWAEHFSHWKKYNPFPLRWVSLARALFYVRKRRFDWAFSGRMDIRDNLLLWLSGAPRRIAYGLAGGSYFLTDCVLPDLHRPHRTDIWLHLLTAVGESPDPHLGGFRLTDAERTAARLYLEKLEIPSGAALVGIHPGARIATRCWGDERFAEVVGWVLRDFPDLHVLWFSEPGVLSQAPRCKRCHTVSVDLRRFLGLLSRCRLLVCNDSGPMHLANLLDVPVVAIFGPQRPEWFGPRGRLDRVVLRPEIWCRPCIDSCIFDQPYCLRLISSAEVYGAVRRAIALADEETPDRCGKASGPSAPIHASRPEASISSATRKGETHEHTLRSDSRLKAGF